ncbi:hypothetical protein PM082_015323 [Marasmius tenuissimus]|nr:hypothetical protein PM082_015323 [Marasmius tenuissimus]
MASFDCFRICCCCSCISLCLNHCPKLFRRSKGNRDDDDSITFPEEDTNTRHGRGQSINSTQPTSGAPMTTNTVREREKERVPKEDTHPRQPRDHSRDASNDHVHSSTQVASSPPVLPPVTLGTDFRQENEMAQLRDGSESRPARGHTPNTSGGGLHDGGHGGDSSALPIPSALRPGGGART